MDAVLMLSQEDREIIEELKAVMLSRKETIPPILISNNETARLLGVNPSYVSVLIKRKKLRRRVMGRSTGILLTEVLEFKKRREAWEPGFTPNSKS